MNIELKTINDAAHYWVSQFNAFPQDMIVALASINVDEVCEVTPPAIGDRVCVWTSGEQGEIVDITHNDVDEYEIVPDNGKKIVAKVDDFEIQYDDIFPMWGTMWQFDDWCDNKWLEKNLQAMANCGFRIYEVGDWGYFFGIDGAGYDFYEAHWIPLYKARGLKWHDEKNENKKYGEIHI